MLTKPAARDLLYVTVEGGVVCGGCAEDEGMKLMGGHSSEGPTACENCGRIGTLGVLLAVYDRVRVDTDKTEGLELMYRGRAGDEATYWFTGVGHTIGEFFLRTDEIVSLEREP